MADHPQIGIENIHDAARRIKPFVNLTPLLEFKDLNERTGGRILLKAEIFQRTGSFKFRGACNHISRIDKQRYPGGVVAFSSGNHAQAVAQIALIYGVKAAIVMPRDAPAAKIAGVAARGGEVIAYDREREDREEIAVRIAAERAALLVPPFDDPLIIAGQGTTGLEIARQAREAGAEIDDLYVPCSGGGLVAGCAIAMQALSPATQCFAVEPEGFDDYRRSLANGARTGNEKRSGSVCDALLAPQPGELTFRINRKLLCGAAVVCDAEVRRAMAYAHDVLKLVVEPGGAAALALMLSGRVELEGRNCAIVLSGANVDDDLLHDVLIKESARGNG